MQEMQWPDGKLTKEFFSDKEVRHGDVEKSRKQLGAIGVKFKRVAYVKYMPHQGAKEVARRSRQMVKE